MKVRVNFGDRSFVYVEGHTHRDAADALDRQSTEEVVANFDALPFAITDGGSESDGEGVDGGGGEEGGGVVELSQAGPLTKKLKAPIATVGEWTISQFLSLATSSVLAYCYSNKPQTMRI